MPARQNNRFRKNYFVECGVKPKVFHFAERRHFPPEAFAAQYQLNFFETFVAGTFQRIFAVVRVSDFNQGHRPAG